MAIIKPRYLPYEFLNYIGNNPSDNPFASGHYQSKLIDRSLTPTFAEFISVVVPRLREPPVGVNTMQVYAIPWHTEVEFPWDVPNASNTTTIMAGFAASRGVLLLEKELSVTSGGIASLNLAHYFQGIIPPKWTLALSLSLDPDVTINDKVTSMGSDNAWATVLGIQAESV